MALSACPRCELLVEDGCRFCEVELAGRRLLTIQPERLGAFLREALPETTRNYLAWKRRLGRG